MRFDTTLGPLLFAAQFLQLSIRVPSANIYGVGEHVHQRFRHDLNWRTWPMLSRDTAPSAVQFVVQPTPAVTYRTIGGVLDFYVILGDSPEHVVQEYVKFVGMPVMPSYWSLGFQLSRYDYGSLDEAKAVVERNRAIALPYDVQCLDIDSMDGKKDFTYDRVKFQDLPNFQSYLHEHGQKYIIILDAAISTEPLSDGSPYESYERGQSRNVWVNASDGVTPLVGEVRTAPWGWVKLRFGQVSAMSNARDPRSQREITPLRLINNELLSPNRSIINELALIFPPGSVSKDMNEVASFVAGSRSGCEQNEWNFPPYTPRESPHFWGHRIR
ncbi:UNVERIFIED_CONTAM: hypothetical protein H355_007694 [Colinus virginianus]|nr:hypothetical protein H355_007694 [Colinus virginianus]